MTTSSLPQYTHTEEYAIFDTQLACISMLLSDADDFHLALYYSNVVTTMEKYLSDLYLKEITSCDNAFNIHRNGFDLNGDKIILAKQNIEQLISDIRSFILDIDKKFHTYVHSK